MGNIVREIVEKAVVVAFLWYVFNIGLSAYLHTSFLGRWEDRPGVRYLLRFSREGVWVDQGKALRFFLRDAQDGISTYTTSWWKEGSHYVFTLGVADSSFIGVVKRDGHVVRCAYGVDGLFRNIGTPNDQILWPYNYPKGEFHLPNYDRDPLVKAVDALLQIPLKGLNFFLDQRPYAFKKESVYLSRAVYSFVFAQGKDGEYSTLYRSAGGVEGLKKPFFRKEFGKDLIYPQPPFRRGKGFGKCVNTARRHLRF